MKCIQHSATRKRNNFFVYVLKYIFFHIRKGGKGTVVTDYMFTGVSQHLCADMSRCSQIIISLSLSIPSFHHPSSLALLSCSTDLLLLIRVIPPFFFFFYLFLSLPWPCLHYVFVCPSHLPFNLFFPESSGIFGAVMWNSSMEGVGVFIACKLEWYNGAIDACINNVLVPNWIKDISQRSVLMRCLDFFFFLKY